MDRRQTLQCYNCKLLLPVGNKIANHQGFSVMWVSKLKEQLRHRICKSAFTFPKAQSLLCKYDMAIWQFAHSWISVQLTLRASRTRSIPWTRWAIWHISMVNIHKLQNALWLSPPPQSIVSLAVWREAHLELFICFYGDSAFLTFSHFLWLLCFGSFDLCSAGVDILDSW